MSLRVRLLGTIVGAIVLFFLISVIAARLVLQHDLLALGETEVTNGAGAFGGYWDSHKDQIKLLVSQDAVSDSLRKNLESKNVGAMRKQLADIARTSGLSFLTIVDGSGKVIARANGPQPGTLAQNTLIQRALTGETVSTATLLGPTVLAGEGLASQAQADIKGRDGKSVAQTNQGLALVAAAPISDQNERTIGAIYGGILLNHEFTTNGYYDLIDQAAHSLGGASAILEGNAIVASTIMRADGTRAVDVQVPAADAVLKTGQPYTGPDTEGGTQYLVHIDPVQSDQNKTIGARWYGVPMTQITGIINHTTQTLVLWGLLAMIIALALAIPIVQALSNTLAKRSQQVRAAAKELGVVIVGAEVSGDHIAQTKAAVEKSGALIAEIQAGAPSPKMSELRAVNDELESDIIVIDALSQEMSGRMQQAVHRVAELNEVAGGLNELVTGEKN